MMSMGIYCMEPEVFEHIPAGVPFGFDDLAYCLLSRGEHIHTYRHDGLWLDIGRVEDFQAAQTLDLGRSGSGARAAGIRRLTERLPAGRAVRFFERTIRCCSLRSPCWAPRSAPLSIAALRFGWITLGERVRAFERAFAERHGAEDAVAVNSCTAALHLALEGPRHRAGRRGSGAVADLRRDRQRHPLRGAEPVLVDIEALDAPLMSVEEAAEKDHARAPVRSC